MPMRCRYRFVGFGTNFTSAAGTRHASTGQPSMLFENELAVDVGGVCWSYEGEERRVVDHHFVHPAHFPSAAAAVVHLSDRIHQQFAPFRDHPEGIWLVSHHYPDFDALCSMYLASDIAARDVPPRWNKASIAPDASEAGTASDTQTERIDWFAPAVEGFAPDLRWPILLASYASAVDQGRTIRAPRNRALHSVLYAALVRGRHLTAEAHAATPFFDAVKRAILERDVRPLFDDVLGDDLTFRPEFDLLDGAESAYRRDLAKSRRSVVSLPIAGGAPGTLMARQLATPLLSGNGNIDSSHRLDDAPRAAADAIWIRDPECLLFKEWARQDVEGSSLGEGFTVTAVAYSNGRPVARRNTSDYFFAIDFERARGRHLYPVWSALQAAELKAIKADDALRRGLATTGQGAATVTRCRPGFEARAAQHAALFDDPWFDGSNYAFTIVATPNRGSCIGDCGTASDLSDDPVARIVQEQLEGGAYQWPALVTDFPSRRWDAEVLPAEYQVQGILATPPAAQPTTIRFVQLPAHATAGFSTGRFAEQSGRLLWNLLEPDARGSVPGDFTERHLLVDMNTIVVWSRRGIGVAYDPSASERIGVLKTLVSDLATLSANVQQLVERSSTSLDDTREMNALEADLAEGERLLGQVTLLKHRFAQPEGRPLRRLFDALAFGDVLDSLRDLVRRKKADRQNAKVEQNIDIVAGVQVKVEWIEILIISFYTAELAHIMLGLWFSESKHGFLEMALIAAATLVAGGIAAFSLEPWHYKGRARRMLVAPVVLTVALVAALGFGAFKHFTHVAVEDTPRREATPPAKP